MENFLNINNLSKSYFTDAGLRQIIPENINLQLKLGENSGSLISILAPLGSGKTTLLRTIAGLDSFDGEITLNGKIMTEPNGDIIYVPEKPSTFTWLNVKENILLPSKLYKKIDKKFSFDVNQLINLVGLSGYEDFFTSSSISGFRLKIAISRALSFNPKLILLDDIFKNLDAETRIEMIDMLKYIIETKKISFILATANISDAILLSKKIFLMRKNPGRIIKEIDVHALHPEDNSEIITKYKNEIEGAFKAQGMFNSVLVSL